MTNEVLPKVPKPLTEREKMWLESFHGHETPGSLKLSPDYFDFLHPDDIVLEVGCASGRVALFLAKKRNVTVTGVDINSSEIAYAKDNSVHPKVNFVVMDGTQLELPNNSFDAIVMVGVIGGVEPEARKELLSEAFRVIKPGGTVAIAEFKINLEDPKRVEKYKADEKITGEWGSRIIRRGEKILFIAKHFTEKELHDLFSDAGFSSIELREHTTEAAGIGDGIVETRRQFTVWATKSVK